MEAFDEEPSIMVKTLNTGFLDPDYREEDDTIPEKVMNMGEEFLPRSGHSATLIGNHIYLFGGLDSDKKAYDSLLSFDIEQMEIMKVKPKGIMPKGRASHAACADILQSRIYFHGGADISGTVYDDLISYSPVKNRFESIETTGDKPPPLYGHSLVPYKHYLYLFGGTSGFVYFNHLFKLDLITKVWTEIKSTGKIPESRYKHCVVCNYPTDPAKMPALNNDDPDCFYVIGGNNGKINFGTIHKYDLRNNKWENLKIKRNQGLFKGRFGHSSIYFNESIYIFGGWADKKRRNDLLRFNFQKSSWVKEDVGDEHYMPSERDFHASVLQDNYFYIIGGSDK